MFLRVRANTRCGRRYYVFGLSVRPILVEAISQEHLEEIRYKHPLGLKDEQFRIWWSEVKLNVTTQNMFSAMT